jgi:putative nucleotidyltransferase with HDIG domain
MSTTDHIRILAVDDEPQILMLYKDTLTPDDSPNHIELTICQQAEEAVEAVHSALADEKPFAVAFLDVRMPPGRDGVWAAEQIRSRDPYTEIVIVTGYSDSTPDEMAGRVPPTDKLLYLQKPFHTHEIKHFALALSSKWLNERVIRQTHTDLEAQVEERTKELLKLNEQLQNDIAMRNHAEQEVQYTLNKLRRAMGGVIQAMALTVERRDPYTAGHQRRVADLARGIATEMGLSVQQIDGIRMAGLIHDLGKIGVPAEILSKPGKLTETEQTLIMDHPRIGYEILKEIEFPWPIAEIVLQHHEKMDGSGYPMGLANDEIMIEARTLAVADVVEAMASHRPYRPALGITKALGEIADHRGITYDADVVDACMRLFTEKNFKFRQ